MADAFSIWPRRRSTAVALGGLVALQALLFFVATRHSFFSQDDYAHFALAQERSLLHYVATPIIHTYPAPGHRVLFLLLYAMGPLNYLAARTMLIGMVAITTILLGQLVRILARSQEWWTVALLTPFALSLTLVGPVNWWSNGVPVVPALLFTVLALSSWIRSYTNPNRMCWAVVTVVAVAAAGAFYMKFLLIPLYLLLLRLAVLPRLLDLPRGIRPLWHERRRWLALAAPPAVFLAVYVLSGLAARSYVPGERPYLEYLATGWFRAFVPVAVLNTPLDGSPLSTGTWLVIVCSQLLFWAMVVATWWRSPLALRGWALFGVVFVANLLMVGAVRLPGFGVEIAYALRYYPEVVLFLPIALALGLRQGEERRPQVAWERSASGQVAIGALACAHALALAFWAPRIVSKSEGVLAKVWFDNLRHDIAIARQSHTTLRIVDSSVPEYVASGWMAPHNRISTMLGLLDVDAVYNELSDSTYVVSADGRLGEARFRPMWQAPIERPTDGGVRVAAGQQAPAPGTCFEDGRSVLFRPDVELIGERLALRVFYSGRSRGPAALQVDNGNGDDQLQRFELRPFQRAAELVDLGTARVRALALEPSPGDIVCIDRIEVGSLDRSS